MSLGGGGRRRFLISDTGPWCAFEIVAMRRTSVATLSVPVYVAR
jgi:hypothetical protein